MASNRLIMSVPDVSIVIHYKLIWEGFEDTKGKGVIRIRKSIGQKKKDKRTNKDLQNIHIKLKIKDRSLTFYQ